MADQHTTHVHLYERYPGKPVHCLQGDDAPFLEVGDAVVTDDGRTWDALPCWSGSVLVVRRDVAYAQVATRRLGEPSGDELRELASSSATA